MQLNGSGIISDSGRLNAVRLKRILKGGERKGDTMEKSDGDKHYLLRIVRDFDASPERVYQAWTDPRLVKRWFGPSEFSTPIAEIDLRIGGTYRIGMKSPDGELYVATGEYREVVQNRKLVFTWRWEDSPSDTPGTLVTVEFKRSGQNTELVFTHENFTTEELMKDHQEGWEGALSKLETFITAGGKGYRK
jgi:uncharacterized protein YndB with AHSA1/START domain